MSEHKIIIENASLGDIRALIGTRDKWGDSGAPVWITLSEDNARTGVVRWSLRSSQDWRHSALGRIEAKQAATGGISLTFQVPALFPDPGILCYLVSETTEEIEKRGYAVQEGDSRGRPGRRPLTNEEWEERFVEVEKVERRHKDAHCTYEQACGWVGIPHGTFRGWRKERNKRREMTNK